MATCQCAVNTQIDWSIFWSAFSAVATTLAVIVALYIPTRQRAHALKDLANEKSLRARLFAIQHWQMIELMNMKVGSLGKSLNQAQSSSMVTQEIRSALYFLNEVALMRTACPEARYLPAKTAESWLLLIGELDFYHDTLDPAFQWDGGSFSLGTVMNPTRLIGAQHSVPKIERLVTELLVQMAALRKMTPPSK